jgi:hypothetical protein
MALDLDNGSTSNTKNTGNNTSGKTNGYINLYLRTKGGGKKKVGFLSLTDTNEDQADLRKWLEADAGNIALFASKLIIEYNSAVKKDEHKFDLG